jgi:hypothetical protein
MDQGSWFLVAATQEVDMVVYLRGAAGLVIGASLFLATRALLAQNPETKAPAEFTSERRIKIIEAVVKKLNDSYVFPETAKKIEDSVRARVKAGEYEKIANGQAFAESLTRHLQEVSHDKHLRIRYSAEPLAERRPGPPPAEEREKMRKWAESVNYGFEKVEKLPGNIGYIDLRGFLQPDEAAGKAVADAMNKVADSDALIFDLRQNGGGSPEMVRLVCSYLFDSTPVHLNSLYWREGNRTDEFWTLKDVPGKRFLGKDVYVLTSKRTFSGAEEFSYNLQNLKRATIVGETTGGGAHPGGVHRLDENFSVFIPTGRAINPITKTNWEGKGVKPEVEVSAESALKTAQELAIKRLLSKTSDSARSAELLKVLQSLGR